MENNFRKIGKIKGSHGIKGEVFILVFSKDTSWVQNNMTLRLSKNDTDFKNKKILKFKPHKEGVIATLESVVTRNESDLLIGHDIWIEGDIFQSKTGDSIYLVEIENFEVIDETLKNIGFIKGFSTNGLQDLLVIENKKDIYEIPFVKEFIVEIDYQNKIVKTKLPEGLLDINKPDEN